MAIVDPNDGILKWQNGDVVTPQAAKENMHLDSVGLVTNKLNREGIYRVNTIPDRTALVNRIGSTNINNSNPLIVWRANATAGQQLEYTTNGGNWYYVRTSQDTGTWSSISLNSGYTGTLEAKVFSGLIHLSGEVLGTFNYNTQYNIASSIPTQFRPTREVPLSLVLMVGGAATFVAAGVVNTAGNVWVRSQYNAPGIGVRLAATYPTD